MSTKIYLLVFHLSPWYNPFVARIRDSLYTRHVTGSRQLIFPHRRKSWTPVRCVFKPLSWKQLAVILAWRKLSSQLLHQMLAAELSGLSRRSQRLLGSEQSHNQLAWRNQGHTTWCESPKEQNCQTDECLVQPWGFIKVDGGNRRKSYLFFWRSCSSAPLWQRASLLTTAIQLFSAGSHSSLRTANKRGGKKQLRRKLTREQAHYAATATCYLCRGCKRPASPPGTVLCDWTSRELEAGLYISAMLAIGHSPKPVIHCPGPLYDKLKLVNSRFANKNILKRAVSNKIYRISREVDMQTGGL